MGNQPPSNTGGGGSSHHHHQHTQQQQQQQQSHNKQGGAGMHAHHRPTHHDQGLGGGGGHPPQGYASYHRGAGTGAGGYGGNDPYGQSSQQQQQQQHPYGSRHGAGYHPQRQQHGGGNNNNNNNSNSHLYGDAAMAGQMQQQKQHMGMEGVPDAADMDLKDGPSGGNNLTAANFGDALINLHGEDDDTVPTVFRWEHGGRQVYVTGTFNGWSKQIPMHRSGNDFTYIHNLKKGKHAFKFIVDDEWRFAPDQPTVADIEGRINNFIDVSDFKAYTGDRDFEEKANLGIVEDIGEFSQATPDLDEYTKEPPPLPPHLRHIILNKPPQLADTAALPVPQHVALNHLYCTAIKDNTMVLGITQRYKTKFVTTVYYSPCKS